MKRLIFFLSLFFFGILIQAQAIKIMLASGGHLFNTLQFIEKFDAMKRVEYNNSEPPIIGVKYIEKRRKVPNE